MEVINRAVEAGHLDKETPVFSNEESNRIMWHDDYFLHTAELVENEYIYANVPIVNDWQFED